MNKIVHKVKEILVQVLHKEPRDVKYKCKLGSDLDAHPIDLHIISVMLEKQFGIQISEGEISADFTVKDLVNLLVNVKGVK